MKFEEAVRKSIKAYFDGRDAENFLSENGDTKYTRDYFDEMEKELVGDDADTKRSKDGQEEELLDGDE
jgi:hypothetical protein